ncbi:KAP family P-loop NTPase fold protein [Clostridium perfringens]|uniref:KAP family P-loop NTPase fold protein n=1 Tax=Clostridium perfringens TaxID=1502 RepID=UPI0034A2F77C
MEEINLEELTFEKDDLLNRKQIAINLTNILKNKSNLNVLAIDSSWGTGKTTFINKWINMLKTDPNYNDNFETIYFNAWENDYSNDALLSLICQINKSISKTLENNKTLLENHKEKFKKIGKLAGTLAIKYAARGALDSVDWNKNLEDGLSEFSNKVGESIFKQHTIQNDTRKILRKNLIEYQNIIGKKIIIFIDELDRCKPTYSIQILETIKHLFNLNNYVFVISLDKIQLSHSIKTIYGQDMDSDSYLRRFFDLDYTLPANNNKVYIEEKFDSIFNNFTNTYYFKVFLKNIFIQEKYSLRDIDKALSFSEILISNVEFFNKDYLDDSNIDWNPLKILISCHLYSYFINIKIKHSNLMNTIFSRSYEDTNLKIFPKINTDIINLESDAFDDSTAHKLIYNAVNLLLRLNLKISDTTINQLNPDFRKSFFLSSNNDNNNFISYTYYDKNKNLDLMFFFNEHKILEKFQFADSFKLS